LNLPVSVDNEGLTARDSQRDSQDSGIPGDLQRVIDSWAQLSEPLKTAILAIVKSTSVQ